MQDGMDNDMLHTLAMYKKRNKSRNDNHGANTWEKNWRQTAAVKDCH